MGDRSRMRLAVRRPVGRGARLGVALAAAAVGATLVAALLPAEAYAAQSVVDESAPIVGLDRASAVPGRYLVVLDDAGALSGQPDPDAADPALVAVIGAAERAGGTIVHTYHAALRGFAATLPAAALDAVRGLPGVAYVEADGIVAIPTTGLAPGEAEASPDGELVPRPLWNQDRIDQRALPLDGSYASGGQGVASPAGTGVTAYVLDTGIWATHPEFAGRASYGPDLVDGDGIALDCNGHGTHVAGTLAGARYGVAPGASVVGLRVVGCDGAGLVSDLVAGVDWVLTNAERPSVAVLGVSAGPSRTLSQAVAASLAGGLPYVAPAGDDATGACSRSPARVPNVLTVGSSTPDDAVAAMSNTGRCVDLFAPGVDIRAAWPSDTGLTDTLSGTSAAAAHVAGIVARLLQGHPDATPERIVRSVVGQATRDQLTTLDGSSSRNRLAYALVH